MVRLAIVDHLGNILKPKEVASATDLVNLVEQAKAFIRECEHLTDDLRREYNKTAPRQVPYST